MGIIWFNCTSSACTTASRRQPPLTWGANVTGPRSQALPDLIAGLLKTSVSFWVHFQIQPKQTWAAALLSLASDRKEAAPPPARLHFLSATSSRDTIGVAFIQQPHKVTRQRLRCEEKGNGGREKLRSDPPVKDERGEWGRGKPEDWPLPIRLFLLLVLQLTEGTGTWKSGDGDCVHPFRSCLRFEIVCY